MSEWLPEIEKTYAVAWPFLKVDNSEDRNEWDLHDLGAWKPGFENEYADPYGESSYPVCDGMGQMLLTVVSLHKPGPKYPTRVFYTRKWIDPDGKVFGASKLRTSVAWAFRNKLKIPEYLLELEMRSGGVVFVEAA
ncbi:hypothetical protein [Hyphomonas sp. CY54-11-8]|uniref:hypothetical protein n=1 Tax=Hyphomonas sp. CY54-11-8 TaxID=1280944 RepID=UPI000458F5B0|nr:hypothetical protein [Hyphomonas sp. CY54-11-8]KCZ47751.1 hypothetical protein HY17_04550 [Hyphomonas sp. CY54-11-8]